MRWHTSTTLLEGLTAPGQDAAWDRFVGHFRGPLIQLACRRGLPPADAEDVAQEALTTFLVTLREGRYRRDRGRLSQWLYGITVKHIRYARRRRARRGIQMQAPQAESPSWVCAEPLESAEEMIDRAWDLAVLEVCEERVKDRVAPDAFRAFEMVVHEECSPAQVAEMLGVSVKWVYNAKHRVLQRIRETRRCFDAELAAQVRHGVN